MKNDSGSLTSKTDENKNALVALQWIISLAELVYSHKMTLGDYHLSWDEAADLINGDASADALKEELDEMVNDPDAYRSRFSREMLEWTQSHQDKTEKDKEDDIALRHMAMTHYSADIKSQIKNEIKETTRQVMNDWDRNLMDYKTDTVTPGPEENNAIISAAARVVWMHEARQKHAKGKFYIKTADGEIKPAFERQHVTLNGVTIEDQIIDNKPLSVDQTFYDRQGDDIYTIDKLITGSLGFGRHISESFFEGTPVFADISDESLIEAINNFTVALAKKSPFLAVALTGEASPVLKGLKSPIESAAKRDADNNHGIPDLLFGIAAQDPEKWGSQLEDLIAKSKKENAPYNELLQGLIDAAQDKIDQSNVLDKPDTPDLLGPPLA